MITDPMKASARHWVVRLSDDSSAETRDQFESWLAQDPVHSDAYRNATQVWDAVAKMKHLAPLALSSSRVQRKSRVRKLFHGFRVSAVLRPVAVFVSVSVVVGIAFLLLKPGSSVQQTAIAEIRDVALSDGSTATLGGQSMFDTQYTPAERRVVLKSGEALFTVEKDAARPFIVVADDISVRAVGTQFEVHRGAGHLRISVLEGVVEIAKARETMRLAAGQQIIIAAQGRLVEGNLKNLSQPVTWRSGILRYEDASLAEVLADANRYYDTQIVLSTPQLGTLRLTTSFGTRQIDQLLDSLPGVLPVWLDRSTPGRIVVVPNPP